MEKIKTCKKGKKCKHFLIDELVGKLGGLGNNDFKIKSKEEFKNLEEKVAKLGNEVKKFEDSVIKFFNAKAYYSCIDPMQICWGRRKHLTCLEILEEKRNLLKNSESELEVKK